MKKKIVYISGGDKFDVNDVRAAFEEVRSALNLGVDTVLFGVPVDEPAQVVDANSGLVECETTTDDVVQCDEIVPEPQIEPEILQDANDNIPADEAEKEETAVPILSVLASQTSESEHDDTHAEIDVSDTEPVKAEENITEMLNTTIPDDGEKTLEELLESMAPLREDVHNEPELPNQDIDKSRSAEQDDVDATLENLASEFVETQDKMPKPKKTSERGKIGKLKNILPFKKMKKDDTGLMGDLFGWAGIAANDEDFSIPGFFTNAASKK